MNDDASARLLPPDVTGLISHLSLRDMITTARAVVPNLARVALVGDPLAGDNFRPGFTEELQRYQSELEIIDLTGLPMDDVKRHVAALPEKTAILYTNIYKDGAGVNFAPLNALTTIAELANRPIIIDTETFIGFGPVGGFVADPGSIGVDAADVALRVLGGESVSKIPIEPNNNPTKPIFDWRQLQRWGVSESRLPRGSEIRFRELNAWERYRWQIVAIAGALSVQLALIGGLFYEHRRRRLAEITSRQRLTELARINRRNMVEN
jgi:ABC-type uncharacterized transport system substrate-binding protein